MLNTVKVGAKLKKKDAPDYRLEVLELRTPEGDLPHARARIRISRFDLGVRLYSVSALQDPRLFIQEIDPATHVEMQ
jgi:hypothetical protein